MNPRISLSFWLGPARVGNFLSLCLLVTPDLAALHLDKVLVLSVVIPWLRCMALLKTCKPI